MLRGFMEMGRSLQESDKRRFAERHRRLTYLRWAFVKGFLLAFSTEPAQTDTTSAKEFPAAANRVLRPIY